MRIYTEVIFEWNDGQGKLVETSSKSFEYSGRVDLAITYSTDEWYADTTGAGAYNLKVHALISNDADGNPARYKIITTGEDGSVTNHQTGIAYTSEAQMNEALEGAAKSLTKRKWPEGHPGTKYVKGPLSFGTKVDVEHTGVMGQAAETAFRGLTGEWDRIWSGTDSDFQRTANTALDTLIRAGEGAVPGETYTDPITGEDVPVLGAVGRAAADFETASTQAGEDLEVAEGGLARQRGRGLKEARAGYKPAIREAEAAAAATGFAGTGAGEKARAELAEQFMETVEEVEEDVDIGLEAAMLEKTRAIGAAGEAYGGVAEDFAGKKATYEQTIESQEAGARSALRTIQSDMTDMIIRTRTNLDEVDWSPFDIPGSALQGADTGSGAIYGEWLGEHFDPTKVEEFTLGTTEGSRKSSTVVRGQGPGGMG